MTYEEKRAVIEQLLDHFEDFVLPSVGVAKGDGEGVGILFASGMGGYPSVVELNRCLELLAAKVPSHYKHLRGFYSAEWKTTTSMAKVRNAHGKTIEKPVRMRMRVVPSWVVWRMVDRSLDMLVALWDLKIALELPPALNRKLRETVNPETGEPAWTEAA